MCIFEHSAGARTHWSLGGMYPSSSNSLAHRFIPDVQAQRQEAHNGRIQREEQATGPAEDKFLEDDCQKLATEYDKPA